MSDKKSVLEEIMKDMEDGKEIKIPSINLKDFVERKYGMSDKRYIVPEGMLKAAHDEAVRSAGQIGKCLEAGLRWLSENPIVPTEQQLSDIAADAHVCMDEVIAEWQRRMFLAPEPETICILKKGGEATVNINTRMIICPAHPDGHKLDVELKKCKDSGGFMIGNFTDLLSSSDHIIGIPLLSGLTEHGKVVILEAYRRGKESGK